MNSYVKLTIAALLPVILSVVLFFLNKTAWLKKIKNPIKQSIYGILFGGLTIVGTHWGIPVGEATANCRDASVLTAGLFFGWQAGLIAGVIGGVERWIAAAWGVGVFTKVACTVSTILAGVYAAILRKIMFENKKPGIFISLGIGVVMEVFHLTMVFITNMHDTERAMIVVKDCAVPMITANGLSVMFSAMALSIACRDRLYKRKEKTHISQTVQRWLLLTVAVAFTLTTVFVYDMQNGLAKAQRENLLNIAVSEIKADISDASDKSLLESLRNVEKERTSDYGNLPELCERYKLDEYNVVDNDGKIIMSSDPNNIGFDMNEGEQSRAFMVLVSDENVTEIVQSYGPISADSSVYRKYAGVKTEDGFLQVGYNEASFQKQIDEQVVGITKNRNVGKTGYILIFDNGRNVVSAPKYFDIVQFGKAIENKEIPEEGKIFELKVGEEELFCQYGVSEGYYIMSVYPKAEALQMRNIALYVNTFMEILVFGILFFLIYMLIKKVIVDRMRKINASLGKIASGNLNEVVDVKSNEEFASLSQDINTTVDTLKRYIAEASTRIDKELEFARNIQSSALPSIFPAFPQHKEFDIYAIMDTAKEVGGDFYDFYMTHKSVLNFVIADVSGKGIPAAMFMMRAKTELKSLTENDIPIDDVFTKGNEALCEGNDAGMFVTAWQGRLNVQKGIIKFVNAGHNPPLIKRANGKFDYLKTRAGFVLAGMENVKYRLQEIEFNEGDVLFLYTDGITEATNAQNELFGEKRLLDKLNSEEYPDMKTLCESVKAEVDGFVGDAVQFDDITMLAIKLNFKSDDAKKEREFNAEVSELQSVTEFFETELTANGCTAKAQKQIDVVVEEIFVNIAKYAYKDGESSKDGKVKISITVQDGLAEFSFRDKGKPFNPLARENPDITLSAEERNIGGLGIYMIKKITDEVSYKYEDGENVLTVKKKIK